MSDKESKTSWFNDITKPIEVKKKEEVQRTKVRKVTSRYKWSLRSTTEPENSENSNKQNKTRTSLKSRKPKVEKERKERPCVR